MIFYKNNIFNDKEDKKDEDPFKIKFVKKSKDDMRLILRALKKPAHRKNKLASSEANYLKTGVSSKRKSGALNPYKQHCVIKFRYGTKKRNHIEFLKIYMPQKNKEEVKEKPVFFGDDVEEYEKNMTDKHFKFIISPDNQNVDLKVLTETLVKQMNSIMGTDLYWVAVQHNDTAHKHVHLLINGKGKNGRYINKIDKALIKGTLREMAQDLCTKMVGERSEEEIINDRNKEYTKNRITRIDKIINEQINTNYTDIIFTKKIKTFDESVRKRLDYLISLGLAKKGKKNYLLQEDWFESLEAVGRFNTFLEAKTLYSFKNKKFKLYKEADKNIQSGTVLKIYNMNDENIWNNAAVIETDNEILYLPMYKKIDTKLLNKKVDIVDNKDNTQNTSLKNVELKIRE
ncbi:relaxase/mobilization nuclease domain-containing protein [Treponema putidum]|uniref:relaxase/mobilization nuclease domain-containing protein n=1 Tax=Treponema putidum TaxID=221027 RepID=UPI00210279F5|nr:hypothetical protein [Treponema putidum]UTY30463.1 hypothetical protein E4N75_02070 [Treponema putidum]